MFGTQHRSVQGVSGRLIAAYKGGGVIDQAAGSGSTVADPGTSYNRTTLRNELFALADQLNKLYADHTDLAQVVNALIDDLQSLGLLQ
jgi:hypothetical protein